MGPGERALQGLQVGAVPPRCDEQRIDVVRLQVVRENVFHEPAAFALDAVALIKRGFAAGRRRLHEIDVSKYRRKAEPELGSMAVADKKDIAHSVAFLKTNGGLEIMETVL